MSSTTTDPTVAPDAAMRAAGASPTLVRSRMRSGAGQVFGHVVVLAAILAVWQGVVSLGWLPEILVPTPGDIFGQFLSILGSIFSGGYMLNHFLVTLQEILIAFVIALVLGVALGTAISESKWVRRYAMPYVVGFNAAPKIAFAPVFLVWFGFDMGSKIAMGIAIGMFPILIGTIAGLSATDRQYERLMGAYRGTRSQTFRKLRLYVALPYVFAGCETAIVLTVIGAIIGEFTGGSEGLGYIVIVAQESLNLAQAFAVILLLSIVGVLLHQLVLLAQRRIVFWRRPRQSTP
jgi:NitT/TauT family transport system permease protein